MNLKTTIIASLALFVVSGQSVFALDKALSKTATAKTTTTNSIAKPLVASAARVRKGPLKWQGRRSTSGLPKFRNVRRLSGMTKSQKTTLQGIYANLKRDSQAIQDEINTDRLAGVAAVTPAPKVTTAVVGETTVKSESAPQKMNAPLSEKPVVTEAPLSEPKPRMTEKRKIELNKQLAIKKNAAWVKVQAVLTSAQRKELQTMRTAKRSAPKTLATSTPAIKAIVK